MTHYLRTALTLPVLALALACAGNRDALPVPNPPPVDVYVAGYADDSARQRHGVTWKNGALSPAVTQAGHAAFLWDITASGLDVYACGWEANGITSAATVWKNGVPIYLTDPADPKSGGTAIAVAVSGSDVYAAGSSWQADSGFAPGLTVPTYWKNGVAVVLAGGQELSSICLSGQDVYVGGYVNVGVTVAAYWKNGVVTLLPSGSRFATVQGLAVSGQDVYAAGRMLIGDLNVATVWKNGVAIPLPDQGLGSTANAIRLSGQDVIVAGNARSPKGLGQATLWKNGVATTLGDGDAQGLAVQGSDVYVSGVNLTAIVWKNGVATPLPGYSAYAHGIWVQPR
jgi:hypothetical protein